MAKYTAEEVLEKLKILFPKYLFDRYKFIGITKPIELGCKIHGYNSKPCYKFLIPQGCKDCAPNKRLDLKELIIEFNKTHNNFYDYSKAICIGAHSKIEIICPEHGIFWQTPSAHRTQKCPDCGEEIRRKNKKKTTKWVLEKFKEKHGDKKYKYPNFDMNNIKNMKEKIDIECDEHGMFKQSPNAHIKYGCDKCAQELRHSLHRYTPEEIIVQGSKIHKNKYTYEKLTYVNYNTEIIITCPLHGEFEQTPHSHIANKAGCPICIRKVSLQELEWLNSLNIPIENRYYKIKIPNSIKFFYADGFDPKTNTVYEYNGDYWHGNPKKFPPDKLNTRTGTTFKSLYNKTLEKEKLLKQAGYTVVTMWESDYNYLMNQNKNGVKFTSNEIT